MSYLRVSCKNYIETKNIYPKEINNFIDPLCLELVTENDIEWNFITTDEITELEKYYLVWFTYTEKKEDVVETGKVMYVGLYKTIGDTIAVVSKLKESKLNIEYVKLPSGRTEVIYCEEVRKPGVHIETIKFKQLIVY